MIMVTPLKYDAGLNVQEVEGRLREVRYEFQRVKLQYSGLSGRFKQNLRPEDNTTLVECVGVLLPLGMEQSVQDQARAAQDITSTLHYQIGELNVQILDYAANFENSGVRRVQ